MFKQLLISLLWLSTVTQAAPPRRRGTVDFVNRLDIGYERALRAREAAVPLNVHQSRQKPSVPLHVFAANEVWYSSNWGGIVKTSENITRVSGTFTVPKLSLPEGGNASTTYGASAWVGIDGWSCSGKILQTGIDMNLKNGTAFYSGWYEWLPGFANTFSGFQISEGDNIKATVVTTSSTAGSATLQNLSTGKKVSQSFDGGVTPLCNVNAEWIVEDYPIAGTSTMVPLVDFDSMTFNSISYTAAQKTKKSVSGPITVNMSKKAKCSLASSSQVACTWIGS